MAQFVLTLRAIHLLPSVHVWLLVTLPDEHFGEHVMHAQCVISQRFLMCNAHYFHNVDVMCDHMQGAVHLALMSSVYKNLLEKKPTSL